MTRKKNVGKFGKPVVESKSNDGRNYEFRTIPGVDDDVRVNRDGDVQINGRTTYHIPMITALDGTRMTIQMCIHKAFPDIPMRVTPTQ